jgi:glycosyltransferase involved in cell wall biosynthesis
VVATRSKSRGMARAGTGSRPAHDVAIYAPNAGNLYEHDAGATGGGGAELQTMLLATNLAIRGLDVAHVVYPLSDPRPLEAPAPTLVSRNPWRDNRLHPLLELSDVWRALSKADARIVVVRGSGGYVVPAAAWCRFHKRTLVFAASNDLDFDIQRPDRRPATLRAYGLAARQARRLVVQTQRQAELAPRVFPALDPILIPSFAQPAPPADGEAAFFLWADRLTDYKHPEKVLDLAEALPEIPFRMVAPETAETSPELRRGVKARAESLPNVELMSRRSREQLLADMARAAAVVKTSRVEGMPNTFLEAWSRGVPVLSLSVDPDRRIRDHGVGLLAEGSMDRFVEQARQLWTDPLLRAEIGARGREFVAATHSPDVVADRWAELLTGVLDEP